MSAKANLGWPSFGFFVLVTTHGLLLAVLAWGWQRPALDVAFELLAKRDLGDITEFTPAQVHVLERVLERHAGFGRALLGRASVRTLEPTSDGWVSRGSSHLIVKTEAGHATRIVVEARGEPGDFPIVVTVHAKGRERQVSLLPNQPQTIEWTWAELGQPSIMPVQAVAARSSNTTAPSWAIRIASGTPLRETP